MSQRHPPHELRLQAIKATADYADLMDFAEVISLKKANRKFRKDPVGSGPRRRAMLQPRPVTRHWSPIQSRCGHRSYGKGLCFFLTSSPPHHLTTSPPKKRPSRALFQYGAGDGNRTRLRGWRCSDGRNIPQSTGMRSGVDSVMTAVGVPSPAAIEAPPGAFRLERVMGIEPTLRAWEAPVLPLNYTRIATRRKRA
jgi:hypothetical protein